MQDSTRNNRIARNTLFLYIRMGIVMIIGLYTTRAVLHILGNDDYGVFNVVCGFVAMFGVLNSSFSACINRYYNYEIGKGNEGGVKTVYNSAVRIQIAVAIILVLSIELIGSWYLNHKMVLPEGRLETASYIFHFSMFSMFLTVLQAPYSGAIMAYEKMDYYAVVSIIDAFTKLGFVSILKYLPGDKLLIYGVLTSIVSVANFLLYFIYCRVKFTEIRIQKTIDKNMIRSMLSFSGWSILDPAAYMVRDQGTNMVLNSYFGTSVNAAQGISYQVASAVDGFTNSFTTAFRPQLIQSYSEGQYTRTKNLMFSMSKISYLLQIMFVVPIIIEVDYILQLWLGEGYPSVATSFVCLILIIKSIGTLNTPISNVVSATGNIRNIKVFSAIVISSVVPISIFTFSMGMSPVYAYIALLVLTIINQIGCVCFLCHIFPAIGIREYTKTLVFPLLLHSILVCALPLIIRFILPTSIWRVLLILVLSFSGSLLSGYFIVLNNVEKQMVMGYLDTFLKKVHIKK